MFLMYSLRDVEGTLAVFLKRIPYPYSYVFVLLTNLSQTLVREYGANKIIANIFNSLHLKEFQGSFLLS